MSAATDRNPSARATIVFCMLTALCEGIDLQAAGVAAPGISALFRPTPDQLGTFFSASTFGLFVGAVLGGRLADSYGRKGVLVASVTLFGLGSLITALAWDIRSLTLMRGVTGVGLGGALPMLLALVNEASVPERRGSNVALAYAATPLGGATASLVIMLSSAAQWRSVFVIGGIVPLIIAPLMAMKLPESAAFRDAEQLGTRAPMPRAGSIRALFSEGRALRTLLLWVSFCLALLLLYLLLSWLPTLLVSQGLTRSQAAGAQIGFNLGGVTAVLLTAYLLQTRLHNATVVVIFLATPLVVLALANSPAQFGILLSLVILIGCTVSAAQAFLYATAPMAYPTTIRGVGVGMTIAMGRMGSVAGPKLGGMLKAAGHTPSQVFLDIMPIVLAGSVCALMLALRVHRSRAA